MVLPIIYIVANCDLLGDNDATTKTLADLKSTVIATNWKNGSNESDVTETSLVMDGAITVEISPEGTNENVELKRAMAKVMLYPTTGDPIVMGEGENKVTYTPMPSAMSVIMYNGVSNTNLAGDYAVQTSDYIERMERKYAMQGNKYEQAAPFYSYPNPENNVNRQNSYLLLCVPWMASESGDTGGSYQALNYYYRVPITDEEAAILKRNYYYKINVHIGVLGALDPTEAVEITSNYEIIDWFNMDIDAEMQQYQYLVLDEYVSVMNNTSELRMPYISSSDLDFDSNDQDEYYTEITKVTYMNYNDRSAEDNGYTSTVTLTGAAISRNGFSIREEEGELVFTHPISSEDYVPYTITVKVQNNQGLAVEWKITQYPAIYIVGDYNPDGRYNRFIYGVGGATNNVYDDDEKWHEHEREYHGNTLGGVNNPNSGSSSNNNQNQYTIYITSFDIEGSDYAIGDPRSFDVDNLQYLGKTINGKELTYYYPTRKENVENVIAPAFKIASSWGVVDSGSLTYETAQRRCASYQENGYPAGRWRIPTEAEIEYIVSLSDRGVIPTLFGGDYYSSSGRYYDNESDPKGFHSETDGHSVRCVYDVWYWGNEKIEDPTEFTWGDEQRK